MSALNDFVVAAGSYFGLPEGRVMQGSTVETKDGEMVLVVHMVLTTEEVVGIGKRMGVMLLEAQADERHAAIKAQEEEEEANAMPPREALRAQYNSLPAHQKSAFGSFHKYVQAYEQVGSEWPLGPGLSVDAVREAEGLPPLAVLVEERTGLDLPAHVYVPGRELTAQQLSMAMGMDAEGRYAMDPADLTPEQLQEWGPK